MLTNTLTRPAAADERPGALSSGGFVDDVRAQLYRWQIKGLRCALVTLINYEGSSPRPVGSQLVVAENGQSAGLISGGCLESAVVEEARRCIEQQTHRVVRYGKDSDYFDIQLPCGSGLDVLIMPGPDVETSRALYQAYQERQAVAWSVDLYTGASRVDHVAADAVDFHAPPSSNGQLTRSGIASGLASFTRVFQPRTRLVVAGRGRVFEDLLALAGLFDLDVLACSPDFPHGETPAEDCRIRRQALGSPTDFDGRALDRWSALVTTFHDHEWEFDLLRQAVRSDAFFLTALGSRKTHELRRNTLTASGVTETEFARIKGPAGLDIGGQSPPEIALSILAEVIARRNGKAPALT